MKKTLTIIMIFGLFLVQAQVGINTDTPDVSTDLELGSADKALLLNRVANVNAVSNPKEGMLVFDASADYGCIRVYQRSGWTGCFIGGATESTAATITDKTKTLLVYTHNGVTHNGKINNTTDVLTIKIPYTNASGSYDRVSVTTTAAPGENGDSNTLTLNIPGGTFSANGELTATIKVGGADQEYLVRQSPGDINTIATFPVVMSGISYNVILKSSTAIPDRNFGNGTHDFIYLPVEVTGTHNVNGQPYNKTWLNLNLGAEYAKVSSPNFNPTINMTGSAAHSDAKTYGSYFIFDQAKLACPVGYHLPTKTEWQDLHEAITGSRISVYSSVFWNQSNIPNFAAAGRKLGETTFTAGAWGIYWSSESNPSGAAYACSFTPIASYADGSENRITQLSARCLKD